MSEKKRWQKLQPTKNGSHSKSVEKKKFFVCWFESVVTSHITRASQLHIWFCTQCTVNIIRYVHALDTYRAVCMKRHLCADAHFGFKQISYGVAISVKRWKFSAIFVVEKWSFSSEFSNANKRQSRIDCDINRDNSHRASVGKHLWSVNWILLRALERWRSNKGFGVQACVFSWYL